MTAAPFCHLRGCETPESDCRSARGRVQVAYTPRANLAWNTSTEEEGVPPPRLHASAYVCSTVGVVDVCDELCSGGSGQSSIETLQSHQPVILRGRS